MKNYMYNVSGKYISQYETMYHIIACKKLVTLIIASIYKVYYKTVSMKSLITLLVGGQLCIQFIIHVCSY